MMDLGSRLMLNQLQISSYELIISNYKLKTTKPEEYSTGFVSIKNMN